MKTLIANRRVWNQLKNLLSQEESPSPPSTGLGPITRTLLSASEILTGNKSELEEDFAVNHGFLFQAKVIEELARRVKALERKSNNVS